MKVPKELSGVEELIRSDLGDLQWDEAEQRYHCAGEVDTVELPTFIASIGEECAAITEQLASEYESSF